MDACLTWRRTPRHPLAAPQEEAVVITEVRVFPVNEDKLKAFASVTFDDCFVVRDLKIIDGASGFFVAMPSKKMKDGTFKDIAHPLNNDTRRLIQAKILEEYEKLIEA
jgi:stage V sporulation protein G